jgi:hypothetical protein
MPQLFRHFSALAGLAEAPVDAQHQWLMRPAKSLRSEENFKIPGTRSNVAGSVSTAGNGSVAGRAFLRGNTVRIGAQAALAASLAVLTCPTQAASQGANEAKSSGSIRITASVAGQAQIKGPSDITLTTEDGVGSRSVCVWSNSLSRSYSIAATGSGAGGSFHLVHAAHAVPYAVEWRDTPEQAAEARLRPGESRAGFRSAAKLNCAAGSTPTPSLVVKIASEDLQPVIGDAAYTGTLNLLFTPL